MACVAMQRDVDPKLGNTLLAAPLWMACPPGPSARLPWRPPAPCARPLERRLFPAELAGHMAGCVLICSARHARGSN